MKNFRILLFLLFICLPFISKSQVFMTDPTQDKNDFASFISYPSSKHGKTLFRRTFELEEVPEDLVIYVTADPRYTLFVNGKQVGFGPAVSDLRHWQYDTHNIASFLQTGKNVIAAEIFTVSGARWISNSPVFLLQTNKNEWNSLNSDKHWKCYRDSSWNPVQSGYIIGTVDSICGNLHPWGWKSVYYDDNNWKSATEIWGAPTHPGFNAYFDANWKLVPRRIPYLEQKTERIPKVRKSSNPDINYDITKEKVTLSCPPNSISEILLDNQVLTMGFVNLITSGGKNAIIKIEYQEALIDENGNKGNRNVIEGKSMDGFYDVIESDGGKLRHYYTSWIRTYRYVKLTVETKDDPLIIDDFYTVFTAYPFRQKARFIVQDSILNNIMEVGWRTARLCAIDSYMDCPYYEQLQYIGDTRIQALISYYLTGDYRLARNALLHFHASRQYMGLTRSNYPSNGSQVIPTFSLIWILMLDDYRLHTGDTEFMKQFMNGVDATLSWFITHIDDSGLAAKVPHWNFIDWNSTFIYGAVPGGKKSASTPLNLLLVQALDAAAEMMEDFGKSCEAEQYASVSESLKKDIYEKCYSKEKGLFADTPDKTTYSEITNAFAVLAGLGEEQVQHQIAEILANPENELIQASSYGNFYVQRAISETGMGGYLNRLDIWKDMIDAGLTTFAEEGIESRSDCHAWSASPIYEFYHTVAGIKPAELGFKKVMIKPDLGDLKNLKAEFPTPSGLISASYNVTNNGLSTEITLPDSVTGIFVFNGQEYTLNSGRNNVNCAITNH